jgi:hypothetical protein
MVPAVIGVAMPAPTVIVPVNVVPATVNSKATGVVPPRPPGISPDHLPAALWANANGDMSKARAGTNKYFIFMLFSCLCERRVALGLIQVIN